MEWFIDNIGLIGGLLGIVLALVGFIISIFGKGTKASQVWSKLMTLIKNFPTIIGIAEKVADNPADKKGYAMEQTLLICNSLDLKPTDEQLAEFSLLIDKLVALSKQINLESKNTTTPSTDAHKSSNEVIDTNTTDTTTEPTEAVITTTIKPITPLGGKIDEN